MKKLIYLVCGIIVLSACKTKQVSVVNMSEIDKNARETYKIVAQLASNEFAGRAPGTEGFAKSAEFVEQFLKKHDIKPLFNNSYKDTVMVEGDLSYNIVGLIGDYDPKKGHILLGAHLDHLGETKKGEDKVYNGADDNASGVTAVMQIARELKETEFDKNIIIALFTGEEKGLIGSGHLANRIKREKIDLLYMFNFEMIGTRFLGYENTVFITGHKLSNCAELMNKSIENDFVMPFKKEDELQLFYRSDNIPFFELYEVPCHTISSYDFKNHNHYHETKDDISVLDVNNMQKIIDTSVNVITFFLEMGYQPKMK